MSTAITAALSELGVSIWLDDLSRDRIRSGGLHELIESSNVVGITTNPTIFATALASTDAYDEQLRQLAAEGSSVTDAVLRLTTDDVRSAADILLPVFEATGGNDGWVSIEVGADSAYDADASLAEARVLVSTIDRPNVFIKIPATAEGITAIEDAIAEGISVNVTLIFGLDRYAQVVEAYLRGLERAQSAGLDLWRIHSVASVFVSRVDAEVDALLLADGSAAAKELMGTAGVANARLVYQAYEQAFTSERAQKLVAAGANMQRPLWASTGVKNPQLPDTFYVIELVAPDVINTMPEKTLRAVADHAAVRGDTVTGAYDQARAAIERLEASGVALASVAATLEHRGVLAFQASGRELQDTVAAALSAPRTS